MPWEREQIGACTLYRGDCREILPMLQRIDAVVMDPPYGVGLRVKKNAFARGYVCAASTTYEDDPIQITALLREVLPLLQRLSHRMAVFPGPRLLFDYPRPASIGGGYVSNGGGPGPGGVGGVCPI